MYRYGIGSLGTAWSFNRLCSKPIQSMLRTVAYTVHCRGKSNPAA